MIRYLCIAALLFVGCAKAPPTLTTVGARAWQANEAVLALNQLQSAAIGLNAIRICPPEPCRPSLSATNTRLIIDTTTSARNAIDVAPSGWRAVAQAALTQIANQLDASGKQTLAAYLTAATAVVASLAP